MPAEDKPGIKVTGMMPPGREDVVQQAHNQSLNSKGTESQAGRFGGLSVQEGPGGVCQRPLERNALEPMAEDKQEPKRPEGIWQRGQQGGRLERPGQGGGRDEGSRRRGSSWEAESQV